MRAAAAVEAAPRLRYHACMADTPPRRLTRSHDRKVAGVAAGIAEYFDLDPTLVRLAFVALALLGGGALVAYIVLWIVMPEPRGDAPAAGAAGPAGPRSGQALLVLLAILLVVVIASGFAWFSIASFHITRFSLPVWVVLILLAWLVLRSRDSHAS